MQTRYRGAQSSANGRRMQRVIASQRVRHTRGDIITTTRIAGPARPALRDIAWREVGG